MAYVSSAIVSFMLYPITLLSSFDYYFVVSYFAFFFFNSSRRNSDFGTTSERIPYKRYTF